MKVSSLAQGENPLSVVQLNALWAKVPPVTLGSNAQRINNPSKGHDTIPEEHQLLKNAFVLKNDWLKYNIAEYAYHDSKGECVAYQLCKYFLNPPSGRPNKKIENGMKMTQENIKHAPRISKYNNKISIEMTTVKISIKHLPY